MLSAIYIKGFKTFARPVRIPLEGGVAAIVGPNGSGKSNITDAVLFALGEQSPGVLRAGAMSELIFSGSETLPAAAAAEVTLVLDNASGAISLPYREVSVARRISRAGETEYRINGTRARLQDVRAVAGEAGIGRHSILRQGAVDAIVAGGAAACRLALEEAAGLGVFRRRRLSASRRLEKAEIQLDKSRQLEGELEKQLRRIESEAAAAREYRELESRYRELSLAHLYRVATHEMGELRRRLREGESLVASLAGREEELRREEEVLFRRTRELEGSLRAFDERLEVLEDGAEDLRTESQRADRTLFRLQLARRHELELRSSHARLEEGLRRVSQSLEDVQQRAQEVEAEYEAMGERSARQERDLAHARERRVAAEREGARLAAKLESLRARLANSASASGRGVLSEGGLVDLAAVVKGLLGGSSSGGTGAMVEGLALGVGDRFTAVDARSEEIGRRRGALAAAIGRAESRIRALQGETSKRVGTRLYEVMRARPGYEVAVEAALGEFGAGVLAENVDEGMRLLSSTERVAVRLDARSLEEGEIPPGKPLVECVEVVDARYAEALERLLGGIYVTEDPERNAPTNGYIAVTREGLKLTRTSVSFGPTTNGFAREARLSAELERLDALKRKAGRVLFDLQQRISEASSRLERLAEAVQKNSTLADRASRAEALLAREAARRAAAAEEARKDVLERERVAASLTRELRETEAALDGAEKALREAEEEMIAASSAVESARSAAAESERELARLRSSIVELRDRQATLSAELARARGSSARQTGRAARIADRAARVSVRLVAAVRERRNTLRGLRSRTTDAHRRASRQRMDLSRRAAALAGDLATAGADVDRLAEEFRRAEEEAERAAEEIRVEWGSTLEAAGREARRHPPGDERARLARRLKRFGDVNLLALSQERGLRERHAFLSAQRADAEAAANELNRIMASIDREIEGRFSETFERVRSAFGEMVPRMMEGARGVLNLSEEGVEIGLRLGRRGWKPLRVLSGGERALLALSFLFGIFLSRPGGEAGAFCMLDEAEAALDDLNLARFLAVVDSHRANGQYLLVTHQKRTMAAADVLYGVIQDSSGATTVVSKRMQKE